VTGTALTPADDAAVARALAGVERTPVPPEASYGAELGQRIQEAFTRLLARALGALGIPASAMEWVAVGLAVLAGVALLYFGWRLWARRRRAGAPAPAMAAEEVLPSAPRDAAAWRAELEACLAAGRIAEALAAAWWWLARSLAGDRAAPDWTSRELAAQTGRRDLTPLLRRLDAMVFGSGAPPAAAVRELVDRLEVAL
jgi:hypothetical protein